MARYYQRYGGIVHWPDEQESLRPIPIYWFAWTHRIRVYGAGEFGVKDVL